MCESLRHRGPDEWGTWYDRDNGVYFGHRRLAIIDLSKNGSQPMVSSSGRYVITYNGEIYNYPELRKELEERGQTFRGDCDTEVLVNSIEHWGIQGALTRSVGMFAMALWDKKEQTLTFARDRLGEKPLYYGWVGQSFVFASELKAMRKFVGFSNKVDQHSVASFMRFSYVPAPHSIYEGIYKILPGTYASISLEELERRSPGMSSGEVAKLEETAYWSAKDIQERADRVCISSEQDTVAKLDQLISSSVRRQMISDVPLGAMLSGGIDSSTIVAVMQSLSSQPVKTYTIGFHEQEYNEAVRAKEIAEYLGTDHTELYLSSSDALNVIPRLAEMYDEPFGDSSQIPTYLVSRLARTGVTVALSGDGGDELFGGYTRYLWAEKIWRNVRRLPPVLRKTFSRVLRSASPETWLKLYGVTEPLLPATLRQRNAGEKMHALARILDESDRESLYLHIISHWNEHDSLIPDIKEHGTVHTDQKLWPDLPEFVQRIMYFDLVSYLPDDILAKVDRASMSVSLESRIPFLDRDIVEYASCIPLEYKIRDGTGKWILRKVLEQYVPRRLFERPKMGFGAPVGNWLKGPLREWAEDLIDSNLLKRQGLLSSDVIRKRWQDHVNDKGNWQYHLWDVLMFQSWLSQQN